MNDSGQIKAFLDYLREAEQRFNISVDEEQKTNEETQDIQHFIEFSDGVSFRADELLRIFKMVRKSRRAAKKQVEISGQVVEWAKNHKQAIRSLEQLLGYVRKLEQEQKNRSYYPRTHILDGLGDEA